MQDNNKVLPYPMESVRSKKLKVVAKITIFKMDSAFVRSKKKQWCLEDYHHLDVFQEVNLPIINLRRAKTSQFHLPLLYLEVVKTRFK
jgi:hypothetical protein